MWSEGHIYKLINNNSLFAVNYGVALYKRGKPVKSIPDITEDYDKAKKLVELFNDCKIEPCHIYDIVEDFLTDFEV